MNKHYDTTIPHKIFENNCHVRDPKLDGGMITYHDLEKTSTDKIWTDLMTHLPRFDISRKCALQKTPNPRFRSANNYELTNRATK